MLELTLAFALVVVVAEGPFQGMPLQRRNMDPPRVFFRKQQCRWRQGSNRPVMYRLDDGVVVRQRIAAATILVARSCGCKAPRPVHQRGDKQGIVALGPAEVAFRESLLPSSNGEKLPHFSQGHFADDPTPQRERPKECPRKSCDKQQPTRQWFVTTNVCFGSHCFRCNNSGKRGSRGGTRIYVCRGSDSPFFISFREVLVISHHVMVYFPEAL